MMRRRDYLYDLRDCLLRRQPYKGSEFEGLIKRIPHEWRCMVGLHYPKWMNTSWSYWDPPEYGYGCAECAEDALPLRFRISDWFYGTRFGERVFDFLVAVEVRYRIWRGTWCAKHDEPLPCYGCQWGWEGR